MTTTQTELLHKHHIPCGKHNSEQAIAVAMVNRINEALDILRILEVKLPLEQVVYHHYNNSVEKRGISK